MKDFRTFWGSYTKVEVLRISSHADLPPEAARDLETVLREHGPKSTVIFPHSRGPPIGALAFGTLTEEIHWTDAIVARLHLVSILFANTLSRKRSEEEVRRLTEQLQQEKLYLRGRGWGAERPRRDHWRKPSLP